MGKKQRCRSRDEAVPQPAQHTQPCADCPWSREALRGWLGGRSADAWIRTASSDIPVMCHVAGNQQCAGIAIYRRNTCKLVPPGILILPADKKKVFGTPFEFLAHHKAREEYGEENCK